MMTNWMMLWMANQCQLMMVNAIDSMTMMFVMMVNHVVPFDLVMVRMMVSHQTSLVVIRDLWGTRGHPGILVSLMITLNDYVIMK